MKFIILLIFSRFAANAFAQQMNYKEWQELAKNQINLQPAYGDVKKDASQTEEDDKFIKTVLASDGTREKGSDHLVKLGFSYLYKGDLQTSMRRFNQAWLLNPKNENAYWGFGAIYFTLGNTTAAIEQYEKGLKLNPNSSNIITDEATISYTEYVKGHDQKKLNTALELLNKSYKIDPKNQNTSFKLSVCYFLSNDCTNALKYYNECKNLGGQPITTAYTAALKQKCNN